MKQRIKSLLILVLIIICTQSLHGQVWKHPYRAMGINYSNDLDSSYKYPRKVIAIDSSLYGIRKTYREYDSNGNMTVEAYENSDTTFYTYNSEGYWTQKIMGNDTLHQVMSKNADGNIINITLIKKETSHITSYRYDESGNIIEVFYDSTLYDQCKYDSLGRILKVKNFRSGYMSNVIEYRYSGDTIYYSECPYNKDGVRYNWPCDEVKGVYNESGQISKVISIIHDSNGPVEDVLIYEYNSQGLITEITDTLSNGSFGKSLYFYDDNKLKRIENYSDGQLMGIVRFKIIK